MQYKVLYFLKNIFEVGVIWLNLPIFEFMTIRFSKPNKGTDGFQGFQ
jgi:hypothetical protein